MKSAFLICCILGLLFASLSCAPDGKLEISVTEIDNDVVIENTGNIACLVFVSSPGTKQRFKLTAGESVTVPDLSQPIEVSVVSY
jgi:hypothetical protein